jgi:hypothetical protein
MWPFLEMGNKPEPASARHLSGLFYACLNQSLAWPASTFVQEGQVDFIRIADLTFVEPAK